MQVLPFEEVFSDESGGNIKTPQSEYLATGLFPVVDQGKSAIAGYVNDAARICGEGRPAIIFGDHTRCVKYVGHPFCMGADGVKVLRPNIEADLKYLYYYLKQVQLPDAGYDRHYKYLKRTEIVLFPLAEQRRIAAILDKADALRAKRREALAQLDRLAQAIFVEMFGGVIQGNWPTSTIGDLALADGGMRTGPFGSQLLHSEFVESGVAVLGIDNVVANEFRWAERRYISLQKYQELKRYTVNPGDVLISIMGTCGRCVVVPENVPLAINTKHLCCITVVGLTQKFVS